MTPPAMPSFSERTASTLLLVGRQELLHLGLGEGGLPVVGVGLADDLDVAGRRGRVAWMPASVMPERRKSALASALLPLMMT